MLSLRSFFALCLGVVAAGVIAGCGFGAAAAGTKSASVLVTSDFGTHRIATAVQRSVPGSETGIAFLDQRFRVVTGSGGASIRSINGHAENGKQLKWRLFVNGIQEPVKNVAINDVTTGDHVWLDLDNTVAANTVPAVVGSYPEPFTNGINGKEFPTLLNCANGMQTQCNLVGASLHHAGVKAADQLIGTGSGSDSLAVVVGTWRQVQGIIAAELIAAGPADSGVYAQFVGTSGAALELDAPDGAVAGTLRGNVGLIAASGNEQLGQPTWFVTGTDAAGVMAAARAFTAAKLDGHFAVAVSGSRVIPLPVDSAS